MSKHTPGPWRACEGNYEKRDGLTLCSCGQVWSMDADKQVATVQRVERARDPIEEEAYVESNHEAEANAYLIAAAPDLLEALEHCASLLHWYGEQSSPRIGTWATVEKAHAAIAKATSGGQQ